MNRIVRLAAGVLGALLILIPLNTEAQTCLPSVAQTLGLDPHHTTIAGGAGMGGTQLAAHDTIVIRAPTPTDPTPPPCRSITNNSNVSYFVPWNTPFEWQKFLNAAGSLPGVTVGACCAPDATQTICGVPIGTMNGTANNNLGARWLGVPTYQNISPNPNLHIPSADAGPDVPYWGGGNDVVGPIYACNALGPGVDFAATFVCEDGVWVQTHSVGSCTAIHGACNPSAIPPGGFATFPTSQSVQDTLCGSGSEFQNLTGTGPWSWECYGTLSTATCTAPLLTVTDGVCGPTSGTSVVSAPTLNLCAEGSAGAVVPNATNSVWSWMCSGLDGGTNALCQAFNANPAGTCGVANGTTVFTAPSMPSELCAPGDTASAVTVSGGTWTWTCSGPGGGPIVACGANNANPTGICGSDNGQTLNSPPVNLCAGGTPSVVVNHAGLFWTWACSQIGGGATANCEAFNAGAPVCGPANGTTLASAPPVTALCTSGTPGSYVTTANSWTWVCSNGAVSISCSANNAVAPINGACGGAAGIPVLTAPTTGLCGTGTASAVSGSGPWNWTCSGLNGGATAPCSAPLMASFNGTCGPSNGTTVPNAPDVNLCDTGTPSAVTGTGPWNWTCTGGGGGVPASCSADLCNACTGTISRAISFPRTGVAGACQATGVTGWTETDALVTSNVGLGSLTIQWTDVFGGYSSSINEGAAPWPQFCSPCYLKFQNVTNVGTQVNSDNGACPPGENAGSFVPASGVNVHP